MADKSARWKLNAEGKFYVDDQCIACDACIMEADEFFEMNDDDGHAFVKKQPSSHEEEELCNEALAACPVESIGNDG